MIRVKDLPKFTPRKSDTHKGSYGRVLVIAGSPGMTGAAYLCSKAALRSGSGIVTLGIPERLLEEHYAERHPQSSGKREVILSMYLTGK